MSIEIQTRRPIKRKGIFGQTNDFVCDTLEETAGSITTGLRVIRKSLELAEVALDDELQEKRHEIALKKIYFDKQISEATKKTVKQLEVDLDSF